MKELIIHDNEAGQRLDKLLRKYLSEAPGSFIYKMLRKKNIVLNGKKATGNEHLRKGDSVKLFLADDTIAKFQAAGKTVEENIKNTVKLDVIYEDQNVIFINKPSGMLSQKAKETDVSVVENVTAYLLESGQLTKENLQTFRPSICNRLDRNTSGLIVAGKSLAGLQQMGELFKERTLKKYYLCIVKGKITEPAHISGYLVKDEKTNRVSFSNGTSSKEANGLLIETEYLPIAWNQEMTLLKVHLITGRTHQIRVHMSSTGHPLLGDSLYEKNITEKQSPNKDADIAPVSCLQHPFKRAALHAWRVSFQHPFRDEMLLLEAPLPFDFRELVSLSGSDLLSI